MEPSPFSNSAAPQESTEQPNDRGMGGKVLTLERLLSRVSEGRRPSLRVSELATLNQIDLDGEKLSSIPRDVVASIPSATRLFLQNNSLTDVSFLKPLSRLRYLNLAGNKLQKVNGLEGMESLVGLNLTNNNIETISSADLPKSLQYIQLKGNPVAASSTVLIEELALGLPDLRQVDGFEIKNGKQIRGFLDASSGESDQNANALIDVAMQDVEEEDFSRAQSALKALDIEPSLLTKKRSVELLDRLHSSALKALKDVASPIRVTPSVSRQTSQDLAEIAAAQDAKGFVARVREALPTVRESTDVGLSPPDSIRQSQRLESGTLQRRSISLSASSPPIQRLPSENRQNFRTFTLPTNVERKFSHRSSTSSREQNNSAPIFPLIHAPPDFKLYPTEFQSTLSSAISMLIGSTALPRQAAYPDHKEPQTLWEQSQSHRQKVLDYLFAKRPAESASADSNQATDKSVPVSPSRRSSFDRVDSTISNHGGAFQRVRGGSTISDEMLQGLHRRDRPRAEGLSAAMQGPPIHPPGVQLASLSEDSTEKAAAERVRVHLRRSLVKTLDNAQKRRELEPAAETSVVTELQKLKQTKTLQNLLAVRQGHMPVQPKVLATILESHSRLGSITDNLEKVLFRTGSYGLDIDETPLSDFSVKQIATQAGISPFARTSMSDTSSHDANSQSSQGLRSLESRRSQNTAQSAMPSSSKPEPRALSPIGLKPKPVRAPSSRRPLPEPGSPGSDQDPDPPRTRQDARPIFGGIAKMYRDKSGPAVNLESKSAEGSSRGPGLGSAVGRAAQPPAPKIPPANSPSRPSPFSVQPAAAVRPSAPEARPPLDKTAMLRPAPGTQSQKSMAISRAGSSYLGLLQTSDDLQLIQNAAREAERKKADFQAELWQRMSGIPSSAKNLYENPPPQRGGTARPEGSSMLPSPFSPFSKSNTPRDARQPDTAGASVAPDGAPLVAPSPFSQAGQEQRSSFTSSFAQAPARVQVETEMTPFAQSPLSSIPSPPPMPGSPTQQPAYSAPVLATQNVLTANVEAIPGASSTPPGNSLSEAIKGAVKKHQHSTSRELDAQDRKEGDAGQSSNQDSRQSPVGQGITGAQPDAKPSSKAFKSPFSL